MKRDNATATPGRPVGENYGKEAMIRDLAERTGLAQKQVKLVIDALPQLIVERTAAGLPVTITGFGTFERRERNARPGINPQTRERIEIPASAGLGFSASTSLRSAFATAANGANYADEQRSRR